MKMRYLGLVTFSLLTFLVARPAFAATTECEIVIAATCGDGEASEEDIVDYKAIEGSPEILARVQCPTEADGTHRQVICVPTER